MDEITSRLFALKDEKYRLFTVKLIPNIDPDTIIGVRKPDLDRLERQLKKNGLLERLTSSLPHRYHEEYILHGIVINQDKGFTHALSETERLLPYIDNWAACDLLSPKVFRQHTDELLPHIDRWLTSGQTYTIRFGICMLMSHYLDEHFRPEYLEKVAVACNHEYYVMMMTAWYFATALAKQYDAAIGYIENHRLDRRTHNKTIQKAIESFRISDDKKACLRALRIK